MAAGAITYAILVLLLTHVAAAPKPGSEIHSETLNVEDIMTCIAEIFRERLLNFNRVHNVNGTQFAVLALIPSGVETLDDIKKLMEPRFEGINYRFARPTRFPNQNRRTHAEVVLMRGRPNETNFDLNQFYDGFLAVHKHPPRFAVLYSWIHPCQECTKQIVNFFGETNPILVWDIATYIGHTTKGTKLYPKLTEMERNVIKKFLKEAGLSLIHINLGTSLQGFNPVYE